MITKAEIKKVSTRKGKGEGYCFEVYYDNREYPNFISSAVKTERGCQRNLDKYLRTGKFSWHGNAE